MHWLRKITFVIFLLESVKGETKETKKKALDEFKKPLETYSYSAQPTRYNDDQSSNVKTKVIVETIKSISPSEYFTSEDYEGNAFENNEKKPHESVAFNAFEPGSFKKETTSYPFPTSETSSVLKNKSTFKFYIASNNDQKTVPLSNQGSSTSSPSLISTTRDEHSSPLFSSHKIKSRSTSLSEELLEFEKALKFITKAEEIGSDRYTHQNVLKKPNRVTPNHLDSKSEETILHGHLHDIGSLGSGPWNSAGSQSSMMGASYMRLSSPYYNFHVMLD